jgi:hypothetical protein
MDSSDASNVYITDWTKLQLYFLWMDEDPAGISETRCKCNHRRIFPILPIFRSTTCLHFHDCAWSGLRPTRMSRVSCFLGTPVPWIASDASNVYITGLDGQNILSLAGRRIPQESAKTRRMPKPLYRIPALDISLVLCFFHDCAHGDSLRRRQECYEFRRFLERWVPWTKARICLYHGLDGSYNIYFLWLGEESRNQRNSADAVQPQYRISPILPIFAQRRVLYFHDCAHGDGLRRRQECYEFRCFLEPDGAMDSSDSNVYITDWTKLQHILSLAGQESAKSAKTRDAVQPPYRIFPMLPIFRSTTCLSLP